MHATVASPRIAAGRALRILIVDDNEPDVEMLARWLRAQFGSEVEVYEADSGAAALEVLDRQPIDVALVDYRLPDMDGLQVLSQISENRPATAAILLTGQGSERVAAQAIKRGACDYLVKHELNGPALEEVIAQALTHVRQDAQRHRSVEKLRRDHAEMDHFVRSLSHDMSANFMILENSFQQLKHSCGPRPVPALIQGMSHVEACLRESKRYLEDLGTLARTGSVHMQSERVELVPIIEEVLFELDPVLRHRSVEVQVDAEFPAVWCNPARVKQVISNLLRNALKHGCDPRRPRLAITRPEHVPGGGAAGQVWLRIHDNGPGIPEAFREEIFLPGRRLPGTESEGTGMGLAIVKKIIDHYGGSVLVDPQCNQGAAFLISFPAAPNS